MEKKQISTSTFTFENLINSNGLYVDKTQYFYKMVSSLERCYFCSRPRRFGKSLAISTFENIFKGNKELFKGLYIYGTDYAWEEFPVIRFDMSVCDLSSAKVFSDSLNRILFDIAKQYGVEINSDNPTFNFTDLIQKLREKTGKQVVILVDEYDKPLTENIDNAKNLEEVRQVMESFYQIIKAQEPNERFVFMTGITKFTKVSIFSKLNNLLEITMDADYACMFGYTQVELEKYFAPYIDEYVNEKGIDKHEFISQIKYWYNGFKSNIDAETVYNPVSVGQFFIKKCTFQNFWFSTATPSFIAKLARKQVLERKDIDEEIITDESLNLFNIADFAEDKITKSDLIQLLFQTGYLTINEKMEFREVAFNLRFPNYEVENSFDKILFESYSGMSNKESLSYVSKINYAAEEGKLDRLEELFKNFMSEIPYASCATSAQLDNFQLRKRREATYNIQVPLEKYYQTVIYIILKMCGMKIEAESATNKGRIDAVMETKRYIYLFEFKLEKSAEIAVGQIKQKEYFQKFIEHANDCEKKIISIGINFSTDERNICGFAAE